MDKVPVDDSVLVSECLSGSQEAWETLYRRFYPLVVRAVRKSYALQPADIQDLTQTVFTTLCSKLSQFKSEYPLSTFVWKMAENVCIDEYRANKAAKRFGKNISLDDSESPIRSVPNQESRPDDNYAQMELSEILRSVFQSLGTKCRELLRLRFFDELSFKEIESMLGVHHKTLAVQTGRCLDELRTMYLRTDRKLK